MTSTAKKDDLRAKDTIPEIILDPSCGKRYMKGKFLGKVSILLIMSSHVQVFLTST